ncbi:hypothetical protein ILYODFUR_034618 [Ilyodon furcidens]|uniref:Uncharacterized protein n=1 Tax=Ilyodon furcidens TaxID=33524 RepID=A0ABV0U204_9TELE
MSSRTRANERKIQRKLWNFTYNIWSDIVTGVLSFLHDPAVLMSAISVQGSHCKGGERLMAFVCSTAVGRCPNLGLAQFILMLNKITSNINKPAHRKTILLMNRKSTSCKN